MPGNQEGGDHMARKKTLEELQAELARRPSGI